MKELKFEELTVEQKLGLITVGHTWRPFGYDEEDMEFILEMIKKRALGGIWLSCNKQICPNYKESIKKVRETADYPILIWTDEEYGYKDYTIGGPITFGYIDSVESAYAYGKAIGIESRKDGFNVVCNPLLDRTEKNVPCGGVVRTLGPDKEKSAKLAEAICRGMHDGGILTCGKHYPSVKGEVDSHMAEPTSDITEEQLRNDNLYSYDYLNKRGLLDSVMVGHNKLTKIDNDHPATLSAPVMNIFRDMGFDKVMITDALGMMGVVAKFGYDIPRWLSIEAGNDMNLPFAPLKESYKSVKDAFDSGKLSKERLDSAVKRVLRMQHDSIAEPKFTELTEKEKELVANLNKDCIAAVCDKGLNPDIDTDKKHLFVILTERELTGDVAANFENDTMAVSWYNPVKIMEKIKERFKNSDCITLTEYPERGTISAACRKELEYDDIVFVTFFDNHPYVGKEVLTSRIISLMEAWQITNRITALVHLGNPFVLEDLPHMPRIINGCKSFECTQNVIDVLAGILPAKGKIPYDIKLK